MSRTCVGAYFNSEMCRAGVLVTWIIRTHTRHISGFFGNGRNRRCLFTPDVRLFKPNTTRDEGISANSQTQHWTTHQCLTGGDIISCSFYSPDRRIESITLYYSLNHENYFSRCPSCIHPISICWQKHLIFSIESEYLHSDVLETLLVGGLEDLFFYGIIALYTHDTDPPRATVPCMCGGAAFPMR